MNRIIRSVFLLFIVAFLAAGCHSEGAPVIGISASKAAAVGSNYVKAVRMAGGVPVIIPITGDEEELAEVLERVDGIIMT
jgi:gamma-glutamyl-gamma-aminobutyrate hydrolase PuuD